MNVGTGPEGIAVSPDGKKVYVTGYYDNTASVIDTFTNNVTARVSVGSGPLGIAFNWNGTKAYVVNHLSDDVSVIDTATNNVTETVNVGSIPTAFGNFIGIRPERVILLEMLSKEV